MVLKYNTTKELYGENIMTKHTKNTKPKSDGIKYEIVGGKDQAKVCAEALTNRLYLRVRGVMRNFYIGSSPFVGLATARERTTSRLIGVAVVYEDVNDRRSVSCYVKPAFRRHGIGSTLSSMIVDWGEKHWHEHIAEGEKSSAIDDISEKMKWHACVMSQNQDRFWNSVQSRVKSSELKQYR
jgi:GNAT superfamily N-acetyltransferase